MVNMYASKTGAGVKETVGYSVLVVCPMLGGYSYPERCNQCSKPCLRPHVKYFTKGIIPSEKLASFNASPMILTKVCRPGRYPIWKNIRCKYFEACLEEATNHNVRYFTCIYCRHYRKGVVQQKEALNNG